MGLFESFFYQKPGGALLLRASLYINPFSRLGLRIWSGFSGSLVYSTAYFFYKTTLVMNKQKEASRAGEPLEG